MKSYQAIGIGVFCGFGLGAFAIQALHAQAKPPAYAVVEIDVSNPDAFAKEYAPLALKNLTAAGAKYLARGGKTATIEGAAPASRVTVLAFDSLDKAQAAFASAAYKEDRKIGDKYAKFRIFAVEGIPQ